MFYLIHSLFAPARKNVTTNDKERKNLIEFIIKNFQNTFNMFLMLCHKLKNVLLIYSS